jgi:cardiolipin synthase
MLVKLLIQPEDGIAPLLEALDKAKKTIRILIFRFDRPEIEKALVAAVQRGVAVQAMIAFTNAGEEKNLRRLEMRLLEKGVTVTRTADDLVRYHGKMIIVDDKVLYLLAYNFTHLDIDLSRSLGIVTKSERTVKEAVRLFECDAKRKPFTSTKGDLVVSPVNARERLTKFIADAKKSLLLYEMKISDREFLSLLNKKISEGVVVRVLSRAAAKNGAMPVRRLAGRLHLRAILRDGDAAFVGSQSLRKLELDARREIGIVFRHKSIVKQMETIFENDWKKSEPVMAPDAVTAAFTVPAKKVAREVIKQVSMKPVIEQVLDKVIDNKDVSFEPEEVAQTMREVFREEVQGAVVDALRGLVTQTTSENEKATTTQGK